MRPLVSRVGDAAALRVGLVCEALGLMLLACGAHPGRAGGPPGARHRRARACAPRFSALVVAGRVGDHARGGALGMQQGLASLARIVGPALGGACYALLGTGAPFLAGGLVVVAVPWPSPWWGDRASRSSRPGVVEAPADRLPLSNNG